MYTTTQVPNTNPVTQSSILNSQYVNPDFLFNTLVAVLKVIFNAKVLEIFYAVLSFLAIIFIAIIVYSTIRILEVRKKEHAYLHHEIEEYAHHQAMHEKEKSTAPVFRDSRWKRVLDYLFSDKETDWKLAVIEADLMLFDLLTQLNFQGDTLGDKLKNADRESFRRLSDAWEVHNIRNKIAHEGSSFSLSLHEAKRVISLYEGIFQEFAFI